MMTTGLLALTMVGVKLTTSIALVELGLRYRYDERTQTLYLDAGLTLEEVGHVCEEMLETVVNRLLVAPVLREQDPAG